MAHLSIPEADSGLTAEFIEAIIRQALLDADRVAWFLIQRRSVGDQLVPPPNLWSGRFLLELAGALRLACWEQLGIWVHRAAGLPTAHQALIEVLQSPGSDPISTGSATLSSQVFILWIRHFAWSSLAALDADLILVGDVEEDRLLDSIADLLWSQRHHWHSESLERGAYDEAQGDRPCTLLHPG